MPACARIADPQHDIVAVTARASATRCTSTSRAAIPGQVRWFSVLLKPEFAPLVSFNVGSKSARICRTHGLSRSTAPRRPYRQIFLYELRTGSRICPSKPISVRARAQRVQTRARARVRSVESLPTSFRPRRCVEKNRFAQILSVGGFHTFRPALRCLNLRFLQFFEFP